nr:hypothetical protein [Vibrio anguillarum]MBF4364468.1 hypothetical protein [Vibrio anguillarum]MBF4400204.1 hypothetical protein [Vibrio anguillarum]MBF4442535.1 hypothetical protein [Vibrio anguillarum]
SHRSIELPDRRTLVAAKVWVSPYPIALVIIHTSASRGTANAWHFYHALGFGGYISDLDDKYKLTKPMKETVESLID